MAAAGRLIRDMGAEVSGSAAIMELSFLKGREKLGMPFESLIKYDD